MIHADRSRAKAACLKAEAARRSAQRLIALRKKDVVLEDRIENAVAEATALEAECRAAHTEVGVLEAELAVTKANIERTRLTAPVDGFIAQLNGELFEFVTPSPIGIAHRLPSTSLITTAFMSSLQLTKWMPPASSCR